MALPSDISGEVAEASREARRVLSAVPDVKEVETVGDDEEEEGRKTGGQQVHKQRRQARRTEALTLRLAGMSYDQIGDRLGISAKGAQSLVSSTLERADNRAVEEMRDIENARLDRSQAAIWTKVLNGDLQAVDTFLRISARRARMNGLDSPTNINLSVGIRNEMEDALTELSQVVLGEVTDVRDEPYPPGDQGADG